MVSLQPSCVATLAVVLFAPDCRHELCTVAMNKGAQERFRRLRVSQGKNVLRRSTASVQMRDSTLNELLTSCIAAALLLKDHKRNVTCSKLYSGGDQIGMICCKVHNACLRSALGEALNVNVADTHADAVPHPCVPCVICSDTPWRCFTRRNRQ